MNKIVLCEIETFGEFSTMMSKCESNKKPITIEICSSGGCVYQSLAYMARILQSPSEIITVVYGQCMSAAVLPFLAGKVRKASEYSWFMVHESQFTEEDDDKKQSTSQKKQEADQAVLEEEQYCKLLAKFTKRKTNWWKEKILGKGNIYFTAEEALDLGIVDELF